SPSAPMAKATDQDQLLLSADRITWTSGSHLPLMGASDRIVPGQDLPLSIWVRNTSDDPAAFTVTGLWTPYNPESPRAVALAAGLAAPTAHRRSLHGGERSRAPLPDGLASSADTAPRTAPASLTLTVTLTQPAAINDSDDPL